jgi:hypothetical protein
MGGLHFCLACQNRFTMQYNNGAIQQSGAIRVARPPGDDSTTS